MSDDQAWYERLDAALGPPTWRVGDIVCLKAGGPAMVVQDVLSTDWVSCVWFRKRTVYIYDFHTSCLVRGEER